MVNKPIQGGLTDLHLMAWKDSYSRKLLFMLKVEDKLECVKLGIYGFFSLLANLFFKNCPNSL